MSRVSVWRSLLRKSRLRGTGTGVRGTTAPGDPPPGQTPAQRAAWLERVLHDQIERFGAQHPRTIAARNNLASKYAQIGRRSAAIEQFEVALADSVAVLGEEDDQTDIIRENLAWCQEDAGRFHDAATNWEVLLQQRLQRLGPTAVETVTARTRLASAYRRTGRPDAAIAHFERAIEDSTGASAEETESLRIGLALALRGSGRFDEAIPQLRMVLAQRHRRLGARHYDTLAIHHQLGLAYLQASRPGEAVETLERAYRNCLAAAGDPEIRLLTMKVRRDLAGAYRVAGRPRDAAALY
ncbi:tetratricopeptide repeat protein [Marinactinospora thermotolerans]|uniref:tetratricopeptide repeat protein n=1 Tax=Marinactinospora thermotolerans TaxID=531310 RepID=UPI00373FD30A